MVDAALLHRTITGYEALDEKRMDIQKEQAELLKQAEEGGLDKKILKRLMRELRRDANLMRAERETLDEYRKAWLEWEATPLGAHAKGSTEPMDGASQLKRARANGNGEAEPRNDGEAERNASDAAAAEAEVVSLKDAAEEQARPGRKKRATAAELEAERQKEGRPQHEPMFN